MKHIKLAIRTVGLVAAVSWAAGAVKAQDTVYTIGSGGLESFNLSMDGVTEDNSLAGSITLTHVSGPGSSLASVCTDINGTVFLGETYSYTPPTSFNNRVGIQPNWGAGNAGTTLSSPNANSLAAIQAAADIFYNHISILASGTTDQKAGLQLAVWAALYNTSASATSISLDGTRFSVLSTANLSGSGYGAGYNAGTQAAINDAISYLSGIDPATLGTPFSGALLIPDPNSQNGEIAQEMFAPVPEAPTLIAGALLLLPFAASTLRSRNWRKQS